MLKFILRKYEQRHQASLVSTEAVQEALPLLFSIFPVSSMKWRFIAIDPSNLPQLSGIRHQRSTYIENLKLFERVFDFKRLKVQR
jgi:hypothetical protein